MTGPGIHQGGCHCGNVRFEAETDLTHLISCNCSNCAKRGLILAFVPAEKFKLLKGEDSLDRLSLQHGAEFSISFAAIAASRPSGAAKKKIARGPKRFPSTCAAWMTWTLRG